MFLSSPSFLNCLIASCSSCGTVWSSEHGSKRLGRILPEGAPVVHIHLRVVPVLTVESLKKSHSIDLFVNTILKRQRFHPDGQNVAATALSTPNPEEEWEVCHSSCAVFSLLSIRLCLEFFYCISWSLVAPFVCFILSFSCGFAES